MLRRTHGGVPQLMPGLQHRDASSTAPISAAGLLQLLTWACLCQNFQGGGTAGSDSAGSTSPCQTLLGAQTSRPAEVLIRPAHTVLHTIAAQCPGHTGAVLIVNRAAAPPRWAAGRAGSHCGDKKPGRKMLLHSQAPPPLHHLTPQLLLRSHQG